tara:strand:- start:376 stop:1014 length:639 start_codon:yes stop_codon:yes gene_type:complete
MTIRADMPRTYPKIEWVQENAKKLETLLVSYAAVQRGDSYLQGFNYIMTILLYTFKETKHADADTWWCFARIVGLIRPLMPDFNVVWFHWLRRHWIANFFTRLKKHRPLLASMLDNSSPEFSCLITCRWFMIWFTQTVDFEEIFELWDFIIEQPPRLLMQVYTMLTYEIIYEAAPTLTYQWAQEPVRLMHAFLGLRVKTVSGAIERVRRNLI